VASAPAPAAVEPPLPSVQYTEIKAPMLGTFYRASSPDAEPFVQVGSHVENETIVCIIEAMKVFNEIAAEVRGKIVAILVENGQPVEYGQPLFRVDPTG
jgi:acetyl-CoA carboxylase biotin carboxyl carrier protein